jgi:4'-phosphopantetheinyl transferase EntD
MRERQARVHWRNTLMPPPEDLGSLRGSLESLIPAGLVLELGSGICSEPLFADELRATSDWTPQRRAQIWPAGIVGSISHKREHCIVVAAHATAFENVGVDLELDVKDNAESELLRRICSTKNELAQAAALHGEVLSPGTLFLATKEAYFKFQFPSTRTRLDWDDVEVTLLPDRSFRVMKVGDGATLVSGVRLVASGWIVALVTKP